MSCWKLRPSRLSICAAMVVVQGLVAMVGGWGVRAAEPTQQATADEGKPRDPPSEVAPKELEASAVIARIGPNEQILLDEIIGDVNKQFAQMSRRFPRDMEAMLLNQLVHQHVQQLIPIKVLLAELRRNITEENLQKGWDQAESIFDRHYLPILLEEHKLDTATALDAQLKSEGGSLEKHKQKFVELALAQQFLSDRTKVDEEVAPDELADFYRGHNEDYDVKAKVRWEQLLVKFAGRTKQEARRLIAEMSDQVRAGDVWEAVAKAGSEGPTAAEGGKRDWTNQGSLKFAALDQALFELPVGAISPILENEDSVQVVRIVERTPAGVITLEEKQDEIKKQIVDKRIKEAKEKYVRRLLDEYRPRVWTIFDDHRTLRFPSPPGATAPLATEED